jgi:hypothetical protein
MRLQKGIYVFKRNPSSEDQKLASIMDAILNEMSDAGPSADEFQELMTQLERVHKLTTDKPSRKVSPDTLALVAGNILGILVIVAYEQKHVMTSKSMSFVMKPKNIGT